VTISQLAIRYRVHRSTVAAHLARHQVPRHHEETTWDDDDMREAAAQYATGLSLADGGTESWAYLTPRDRREYRAPPPGDAPFGCREV
jgi:hypothetical protein